MVITGNPRKSIGEVSRLLDWSGFDQGYIGFVWAGI